MDYEVAGGFVVEDKKLLMVEEDGEWSVPSEISEPGELSSDTAERAVEKVTGKECEVHKYKSRMKTEYEEDGTEYSWKPYTVKIGDPEERTENIEEGEWVPVKQIEERELVEPVEETAEEIIKRV